MIIIGYQGIGKSTLAGKNNCIDLESGNFWIPNKETGCADRADNWYIPYCQIANHLSEQGYTVFVSSHEVVRNELKKSKEKVFVVCPSVELKEQWIEKLRNRYETTGLDKDFKALANAEDRYVDNINELVFGNFVAYEIEDMDYDLKDIVNDLGGLFND